MSFWTDLQRTPGEPWQWWFQRHQVKLFLAAFVLVFIL